MVLQNRKDELCRKIEGAEGILEEHKMLAKGLVKNASKQFFLDRVWGAMLVLSHRNARVALQNRTTVLEAAKLPSAELEHLLNLAEEAEFASRPTVFA